LLFKYMKNDNISCIIYPSVVSNLEYANYGIKVNIVWLFTLPVKKFICIELKEWKWNYNHSWKYSSIRHDKNLKIQ
jgi:hypothetical protein